MIPEREQLLLLLRLALQQTLEQEPLHLQGPLIRLPGFPGGLLLCCNLGARAPLRRSSVKPHIQQTCPRACLETANGLNKS